MTTTNSTDAPKQPVVCHFTPCSKKVPQLYINTNLKCSYCFQYYCDAHFASPAHECPDAKKKKISDSGNSKTRVFPSVSSNISNASY